MNKLKSFSLDRVLSIFAFFFSLISLFFTWQANDLLEEQNNIARQANEPNVIFASMSGSLFVTAQVETCNIPGFGHTLRFTGETRIPMYNQGARGVSLTSFAGMLIEMPPGSSGGSGSFTVKEPNSETSRTNYISLPAEIPEGSTRQWTFEFIISMKFENEEKAKNYFLTLTDDEKVGNFEWTMYFSDGKTLSRKYVLYLDLPSRPDFNVLC